MAENSTPGPINPTPQQPPAPDGEPVEGLPVLPEILAQTRERLESTSSDLQFKVFDDMLEVVLPAEQIRQIATLLRDELGYKMLMSVTGVDYKASYQVVYHLYKLDSAYPVVLKCDLPHDDAPEIPSLAPVWPGADFQEREVYDLMGIVFVGHPDLRRILLADDFPGHPLRKDWEADPDYVLVPHLRVPGYEGASAGRTSSGRFLSRDQEGEAR
ncbi:MAG TPA: NADH-quinone oxidoreductase subunit C [Chloroflexota bacterium]